MFKYLLINKEGYCYGCSILNDQINEEDMILIDSDADESCFFKRKYDKNKQIWLDEYLIEDKQYEENLSNQDIQEQILLNTEYLVAMQELNTLY